jgi:hypothetical protein
MLTIFLILTHATALCDGGAVLFRKESGPLAVAVFASPEPLAVGTSDISVLLQNRKSLQPVLDAEVSLSLCESIRAHPTHGLAQNKLLYAALVTLTNPGNCQIAVAILWNGEWTHVTNTADVGPARAMVTSYWTWIALPPLLIVGFIIRERLILRKEKRLSDARIS